MNEGDVLGRYELVRLLGQGGMGQVHLARVEGAGGFEKLVALKVLVGRFRLDDARSLSLAREALIGVQLDHQNIVPVLDFGEDGGMYFVATEYVRGFSLADVLAHLQAKDEQMSIRSAVFTTRAIADALDYVHSRSDYEGGPLDLIHGDVSPGNIMVAADGRVKLADFGVAAFANELQGAHSVAGKPGHMPREAYKGADPQQSWDVYALGTVLYEALAGSSAFPGRTAQAVRMAIDAGVTPLSQVRSECPAPLSAVVEKSVSRDPAHRFTTAAQLREALDAAHPRQVDDMDAHRAYVTRLYTEESFVHEHGALPTTGGFHSTDMVPHISQAENRTHAVRGVPTLRLGLSPALGADLAKQRGAALAAVLHQRLQRDVVATVLGDYDSLVDSLCRGAVDIAWMPPAAFCAALERGAGAVVQAQRSGSTTYESALIVRSDSAIHDIDDLRGVSFAWVDRESSAGYVYAIDEIARRLGPPADVLGAQHFHGSHHKVCEAVANGWAAAGATYAVRDRGGAIVSCAWDELLADRAGELRAVAFEGPIPSDVIAHKPGLPSRLRRDLVAAFGALSLDIDGRALLRDIFNAEALVEGDLVPYASVGAIFARARELS